MINKYTFLNAVPQLSDSANVEIMMMVKSTAEELKHVCHVADINPSILVIYDFVAAPAKMEDQLSPVIIVFNNQT